ncbi:MAG: hypothetical protein INR68_12555 [Methylobacterium mesophilicum]|nr:hypothetical protein [Methylobacterium mesophilicum]
MMRTFLGIAAILAMGAPSLGASAVNLDGEARSMTVTEGGVTNEVSIGAGQTVEFCASGCFVTLPNGDREALSGGEVLEISGGSVRIK